MEIGRVLSVKDIFGYIIPGGIIMVCLLILKNWILISVHTGVIQEIDLCLFNKYPLWKWIIIIILSVGIGFINAAVMKNLSIILGQLTKDNSEISIRLRDFLRKIKIKPNGISSIIKGIIFFSRAISSTIRVNDVKLDKHLISSIIEIAIEDLPFYSKYSSVNINEKSISFREREIMENDDFIYECRDRVYMNHRNDNDSVLMKHLDRLSSKEQLMLNLVIPIMVLAFIYMFGFYRHGDSSEIWLLIAIFVSLVSGFICKWAHGYWKMSWAQEVYLIYYLSVLEKRKNTTIQTSE
ncbi:MAG: hypothetical protein IM638_10315 [Bacteroidetes bacterium]|nr:hypothetical protein [Bacteroidota bacterium]